MGSLRGQGTRELGGHAAVRMGRRSHALPERVHPTTNYDDGDDRDENREASDAHHASNDDVPGRAVVPGVHQREGIWYRGGLQWGTRA